MKPRSSNSLFFDLDGFLADFDGGYPKIFGHDHREINDDTMWANIHGHGAFFKDLPPMDGAIEFFRMYEHLEPIILTACPYDRYQDVADQKRKWVREHLSDTIWVLPVAGGKHKQLFMHRPGDILIDDFERNTSRWEQAGGRSILHTDFRSTRIALELMLCTPQP